MQAIAVVAPEDAAMRPLDPEPDWITRAADTECWPRARIAWGRAANVEGAWLYKRQYGRPQPCKDACFQEPKTNPLKRLWDCSWVTDRGLEESAKLPLDLHRHRQDRREPWENSGLSQACVGEIAYQI
jgi:hypothetical protein